MFEDYKDVVNVDQLMEMLDIGRNKAYELINSGLIQSLRIGRVHKIPKRNIIAYIDSYIQ